MSAGHGGASGRFESLKEDALEYAFLMKLENKIDELKKKIAQLEQERQALIAKRNDLGDLLNQALVAEKYANGTYKASKPTIDDTRKDEK